MNTKTNTPGFNTHLHIWFATDKRGQRQAFRFNGQQMRAFRMNLADAEMFVATETATQISGHPLRAA